MNATLVFVSVLYVEAITHLGLPDFTKFPELILTGECGDGGNELMPLMDVSLLLEALTTD
ncbi:hypothetical protein E2C01_018836 [Portunus trituberculatus]|uniref:Uncharacterized protein n=1 Tax=Portunus trituberculatus TaxID=210409 RepID=A0A5B7DY61_PORTR|nr:hypothetical protein [Portunus trituberculatus]